MSKTKEEVETPSQIWRLQETIRAGYWIIAIVIVITAFVARLLYREPYRFFQEFINRLGEQETPGGFPNLGASIVMSVGFGIIAAIALAITGIYVINHKLGQWYIKAPLTLLLALGAIGLAIPYDVMPILNTVGMMIFVIDYGILNFVNQLLRFLRKHQKKVVKRRFDFFLDSTVAVFVLLAIVLFLGFYTLNYGIKLPTEPVTAELAQKIVLIIDCVAAFFLDLDDIG